VQVTPTLCQPCGRHKDRCRCAGRREAFAEAADWCEKKAENVDGYTEAGIGLGWAYEEAAEHFRALANGAP
jgi:hypothetical protein